MSRYRPKPLFDRTHRGRFLHNFGTLGFVDSQRRQGKIYWTSHNLQRDTSSHSWHDSTCAYIHLFNTRLTPLLDPREEAEVRKAFIDPINREHRYLRGSFAPMLVLPSIIAVYVDVGGNLRTGRLYNAARRDSWGMFLPFTSERTSNMR
jgi:hypothetical protein